MLAYENEAIFAQQAGEELEYVVPDETILIENPAAVVSTSENPEAAQAFLDYLYTPEAQAVFAGKGYRPVVEGVRPSSTPPARPASSRSPTSAAGPTSARASSTARRASSSTSRTSWECPLTTSPEAVTLPARTGWSRRAGGLVLGLSTAYLTLIVLIPIAAVIAASLEGGLSAFWDEITAPAAVAALKLTFVASLSSCRERCHRHPDRLGARPRRLPRQRRRQRDHRPALRPADDRRRATLLAVYGPQSPLGFDVAYSRAAIVVALLFVTLPFVVRAVQPVLLELDREMEEAAASLGARPVTTFRRIVLPNLLPAMLSGAALSFGKAVGEFGSIVLISGNIPFDTEVASVCIFRPSRATSRTRRPPSRSCCSSSRSPSSPSPTSSSGAAGGTMRSARDRGTRCGRSRSATCSAPGAPLLAIVYYTFQDGLAPVWEALTDRRSSPPSS